MKFLFNTNSQRKTASRLLMAYVMAYAFSIVFFNHQAIAADAGAIIVIGKTRVRADDQVPAKTVKKIPAKTVNRVTISSGLDFSTGDYGLAVNTNTLSVPVSVKYRTGDWTYRLGTSYLYLEESTKRFLIDGNTIPNSEVSGLGDFVASTRYAFKPVPALNTEFNLNGRIKFGTADRTKGLGTGANDYTVELGFYQPTGSSVEFFGSVGYRLKGDLPQRVLNNVWLGSIGLSTLLDSRTQLGLVFDYRQATINGRPPFKELSPYWSRRYDRNWSFTAYGLVGLTDASPNFGTGLVGSYSY
jgi:hypothetical protein